MPFKQALVLVFLVLLCIFLGNLLYPEHGFGVQMGLMLGSALVTFVFFVARVAQHEQRAAHNETEEAEKALDKDPNNAIAIAKANMARLNEYYTLNKSQARYSFLASIIAITIGFGVILVSIFVHFETSKLAIGTISGVLLQFIGGAFFVMYNKCLDQLNLFYGKLVRLQDTMLAVHQCEKLDEANRDRVRETLIVALIHRNEQTTIKPSSRESRKKTTKTEVKSKAATAA